MFGWRSRLRFDALCSVGVTWAFVYVGKRAIVLETFMNVFVVFPTVVVVHVMCWSGLSRLAMVFPSLVAETRVCDIAPSLIVKVDVVIS